MKRTAIILYGGIIIAILIALVNVLQQDKVLPTERTENIADEDIVAVLEEMQGGNSSVPIRDIDLLVPIKTEPAWRSEAAVWQVSSAPKIAIVIDDLGLALQATSALAQMSGPYTLAFLPYAEDLPDQTRQVKAAGHELMVHLPMQPKGHDSDPGENALLEGLSSDEFERRINWNLSRFDGYVGVNNHMGSLLTEDPGAMVRVMVHLRQHGHLFLDSLTSPKSVGVRAARATGVPFIARDVFLDNVKEAKAIREQLAKTEVIARARGYAVAIGHPYDITLATLTTWQKSLKSRGISLVPLSQIVAGREEARMAALMTGK